MKIMKLALIAVICFTFLFVSCGLWRYGSTLKSESNITYRNNVQIYKGASISEENWSMIWNLLDVSERAPGISKIVIFESEEESLGINIEEKFFDGYILGMVVVTWGGGLELRNSQVYDENGYIAFSVEIWEQLGPSTDDLRYDTFFLKIPK